MIKVTNVDGTIKVIKGCTHCNHREEIPLDCPEDISLGDFLNHAVQEIAKKEMNKRCDLCRVSYFE